MSTMAKLVRIGTSFLKCYDPESMDFLKWLNHFEFIIDFTHIKNNVKVEFLLSVMNPMAHSHIQKKVAPANPLDLPYEVLISHFEELYGLFQGEWAANYRFVLRDQFTGESILQYEHTLRRILNNASPFLKNNESLRIRFVNGLKDNQTRRILRNWDNLTLDKAIIVAAQLEFNPLPS